MSGFWHDHAWLGGLLGDGDIASHLGASTAMAQMLSVEAAYARALGSVGQVPSGMADRASEAILAFQPNMDDLRRSTTSDGVVVPGLVQQLKAALPEELHPSLHSGLTSQDVIDTALILCLQPVMDVMSGKLDRLDSALGDLNERFGARTMMGRTRMQAALEIKVAHRIEAWKRPIVDQRADLPRIAKNLGVIQFGGPVGDRTSFGANAQMLADCFATELGLHDPGRGWHTDRRRLVEFGNWMSGTTAALGKLGTDLGLMSLQGIDDVALSGGGKSSAMAHKTNPTNAEVLATLARWNATLLGGLHQAQIHEHERSGSAWTMEWLILPQMVEATARSLGAAAELCLQIKTLGN